MRDDYGNVAGEYAALRAGDGYVSGFSELVWVRGGDAVEFVDGQVTQDLLAMEPGAVARAMLLEPRGKLAALLWVLRGDQEVGLVVDVGWGATVVDRLVRFRFRVRADVELDGREIHEIWGPDAAASGVRLGLEPGDGWGTHEGMTFAGLAGRSLHRLILADATDRDLQDAGFEPCGAVAADTVRVEAGEPVMGIDVDEGTIPQETGLEGAAVSFSKGCYVGQELVARIDSRGHVNRRLAAVELRVNRIPPVGAGVFAGDREVGATTTVGESLRLRAPVALAMLRREVQAGDAVDITWDGGSAPALVRELPLEVLAGSSQSSNIREGT